jgi:hypothetical protein
LHAGKTYAAVLKFENGSVTLNGKEPDVDRALGFMAEVAPWALYGHSPEIAAAYKNKRQREQLKAHVRSGIEKARAASNATATSAGGPDARPA